MYLAIMLPLTGPTNSFRIIQLQMRARQGEFVADQCILGPRHPAARFMPSLKTRLWESMPMELMPCSEDDWKWRLDVQ
jgi:hypothetical protein